MNFKLDIKDRVCLLCSDSSEGKSFMFKIMQSAECNFDKYLYFNWENYHMINMDDDRFKNEEFLVVFDNADLYKDTVSALVPNNKCTFIVIVKTFSEISLGDEFGMYKINADDHNIEMVKSV